MFRLQRSPFADNTPADARFRQPAEWEPHAACWLAWPSHVELWEGGLEAARLEFVALCRAISDCDPVTGECRGETLEVLVPDEAARRDAEVALRGLPVRLHEIAFGDVWLRDTAPIFLRGPDGELATVRFGFNGWGGKYVLPHDAQVSEQIAARTGVPEFRFSWVLEGGSVEVDGEGTCLTTRQCLLNPNRNPGMNEEMVERGLHEALGVTTVLWLEDGLLNDHTDGHIDTLARFTAPGTVVCMQAREASDPNREVLDKIAGDLASFEDAQGRRLQVIRVPSPGLILDTNGQVMPASYVNFYIANCTVIVPIYGSPYDTEAVATIARCFPTRRTVGLSARTILEGGGAFHCITQQQPTATPLTS